MKSKNCINIYFCQNFYKKIHIFLNLIFKIDKFRAESRWLSNETFGHFWPKARSSQLQALSIHAYAEMSSFFSQSACVYIYIL